MPSICYPTKKTGKYRPQIKTSRHESQDSKHQIVKLTNIELLGQLHEQNTSVFVMYERVI